MTGANDPRHVDHGAHQPDRPQGEADAAEGQEPADDAALDQDPDSGEPQLPADAPEADVLEQHRLADDDVRRRDTGGAPPEVPEADFLEQLQEEPLDQDEYRD